MTLRTFIAKLRNRKAKPQAFADFEAQTLSGAAAALARRGHAKAKARQEATTEALRTGGKITLVPRRYPYSALRERSHG